MNRLFKFFWVVSLVLYLVGLLLIYAFLPDQVGVQANEWGMPDTFISKENFFYLWLLVWVNVQHYVGMWQQLLQCKTWADRWRTLVNKPGWRPDYLGGYMAPPEVDINRYRKYNPKLSSSLSWYILGQYLLTLAGAAWFLFQEESLSLGVKAVLALCVLAAIVSLGWLMEQRSYSPKLEAARMLLTVLVLLQLFYMPAMLWAGVAYVVLSWTYLWSLRKLMRVGDAVSPNLSNEKTTAIPVSATADRLPV